MDQKQKILIVNMIEQLAGGTISDDKLAELDSLLIKDQQARQIYLDYVLVHVSLKRCLGVSEYLNGKKVLNEKDGLISFNSALVELLTEEEYASKVEIEVVGEPKSRARDVSSRKSVNNSKFRLFLTMAAAVVLVFCIRIFWVHNAIEVATVTGHYNVGLLGYGDDIDGLRLKDDARMIFLESGLLELLYDSNVKLVIEAPAKFQILSDMDFHLCSGRLYASVPENAIGFTVYSRDVKVVDLGTEFGVCADSGGDTSLYVMKGKTELVTGSKGSKGVGLVSAGEAKVFSSVTKTVSDVPYKADTFVRAFDQVSGQQWRGKDFFDLADIVGGGNGFGSGKYESGIDTESGEYMPELVPAEHQGDGSYHIVESSIFIEGVFVPDGGAGDVQVDSAGNIFSECPDTAGKYWIGLQDGAVFSHPGAIYKHSLTFAGQKLAETPSIFAHANQGITFDLDKLRGSIKQKKADITRFTADFILSDSIFDPSVFTAGDEFVFRKDQPDLPNSDFWVLVDGVVKFRAEGQRSVDRAVSVDIPITADDRYLTLIVTDHNLDIGHVWSVIVEPRLHFEDY